ncbi:TSCPD domain-containing protein [Clostridium botulinum]|nr:TSCPD domain-containing protein [Clostridium botulinum]
MDEKTFEVFTNIYRNVLIVSGGIALLIGVAKRLITLSKSKKAKELIEKLKGIKERN